MPHLDDTKDHKILIPMPWKRTLFSINADGMVRGHPTLVIGWYVEFGGFFLRIGWTITGQSVNAHPAA